MLIYLDIDGVMVPANSWRKLEFLEDGFLEFSKRSTDALNKILHHKSASIILTTSHKNKYSLNQWKGIFRTRGILVNEIHRLPENMDQLNRRDELMQWFDSYELDKDFIIIDDDKSLNSLPEFYKNRLIQTSASVGLTDYLADEALKMVAKFQKETD